MATMTLEGWDEGDVDPDISTHVGLQPRNSKSAEQTCVCFYGGRQQRAQHQHQQQ